MAEHVTIQPATKSYGAWYTSQAAEASKVVSTKSGVLHTLMVANSSGSARFLWVFDNTAASGTVLLSGLVVPTAGSIQIALPLGLPFTTGLTVASSSTQATFTLGGAEFQILAGYANVAKMN